MSNRLWTQARMTLTKQEARGACIGTIVLDLALTVIGILLSMSESCGII